MWPRSSRSSQGFTLLVSCFHMIFTHLMPFFSEWLRGFVDNPDGAENDATGTNQTLQEDVGAQNIQDDPRPPSARTRTARCMNTFLLSTLAILTVFHPAASISAPKPPVPVVSRRLTLAIRVACFVVVAVLVVITATSVFACFKAPTQIPSAVRCGLQVSSLFRFSCALQSEIEARRAHQRHLCAPDSTFFKSIGADGLFNPPPTDSCM